MARILFLAPSVTQPNLIRPFHFANLLSKKHYVEVVGPAKLGKPIYKNSERFKISKLKASSNMGKVKECVKLMKDFEVVIACDDRFYSSIAGLIAKIKGKRFIFDAGDDESLIIQHSMKDHKFSFKRHLSFYISKFNFFLRRFADEVIVASSVMKKKYGGHVFPVPVDIDFFLRKKYDFKKKYGNNIILFTGVIQRYKGIDYLVESFPEINRHFKDAKLIFLGHTKLGSPIFAKEIIERSKKLSKNIIFLGNEDDPEKVRDFMKSAACLVLPTEDNMIHRMQTPVKLINYMASGTPIVATSVGDVSSILGNGKRGVLVKPNNSSELSRGIVNILNKKKEYNKMAKKTFDFCKKNYSFEGVFRKIEGIYVGKRK